MCTVILLADTTFQQHSIDYILGTNCGRPQYNKSPDPSHFAEWRLAKVTSFLVIYPKYFLSGDVNPLIVTMHMY